MLSHLFWNVATSNVALGILGAVVAASFLIAHVPLVGRLIPAVESYVVAARLVSIATAAALCFLIGFRVSDERATLAKLKGELAWKENELDQQRASAEDAERIAKEKAAEADELKTKVDDYEATLAKQPVGSCALDDADLDGLRAFSRRTRKR